VQNRIRLYDCYSYTVYRALICCWFSVALLQVHKRTTCPEFDEDFVFDVSADDLCERTLEILMYDATPSSGGRDTTAADECTGQVLLALDDVDLTTAETVWLCKGISPHVKNNEV